MSGKGPSLDARFEPQGRELKLIKGLLVKLRNYLAECLEAEEGPPLVEAKRSVDAIIDNLASIAVAVRQTGRRSRLSRADRSFDPTTLEDLRTHLQCIVLVRQCPQDQECVKQYNRPPCWQRHIKGRLTTLQRRLIEANLRRRHRFQYAQRHAMKLAHRQQPTPILHREPTTPRPSERISSQGPETIDDKKVGLASSALPEPASIYPPPSLSRTSASAPESDFKWQEPQDTIQVAKSQITSITGATEYPKLSRPKSDPAAIAEGIEMEQQRIVKCPCCCEVLPSRILDSRGAWKKHLSSDLYPYTCIAEHCPIPQALYRTRAEWEDHVKACHPKKWDCQLCDSSTGTTFPSIDRLQQHVAEEHLESFPEDLLDTVAFWPSTPVVGVEACPLCCSTGPTDDPELIEHILKHTHDFALRSLPWADDLPEYVQQPGAHRFNTNYLASSEPREEHVSLTPWRMNLWFEQLETPELKQRVWARLVFDIDKMATCPTNPSLDRSLDYFAHNVYFDLQEKDRSLGVEDQSDDTEASTIVTTLSRSGDESDEIDYTYEGDGLLSLFDGDDQVTLYTLLQRYRIEGSDGPFWTEKLLRQILTERRLRTEFRSHSDVQYYIDKILPSQGQEEPETYLRVFTLLVLTARVCDAGMFIMEHVCDEKLPLHGELDSPDCPISFLGGEKTALKCFQGWSLDQKQNFLQTQRHLIFPFLNVAEDNTCKAIVLQPNIIRPWRYESIRNSTGSRMGAFGTVSSVEIHPTSHAFDKALSEINLKCELFAIKTLDGARVNKLRFEEELHMLGQRKIGLSSHLVPILEAFQHDGQWSLILPHSNCSLRHLLQYGDSNSTPARMKWACLQLYGITDAISKIHGSSQGNASYFAMHSGIDLDNILCYGRPDSPEQCVLVVSHFPMSVIHFGSDDETELVEPTTCSPTYRPPEWDIQGGGMSKSSDIWSLGCVYLVFLTWLLKGWGEVLLFENIRSAPHIDGTRSDRFYTFMKFYNRDTYVLRVKSQVMAQIQGLECHEKCSRAILMVLSMIKSRMLVVLSTDDLRSSSSSLRASFEGICEARHKESYYWASVARPHEAIHAISPPAVEVNLSSSLRQTMRPGSDSGLPIYAGQAQKSLW
ncbi:hypothetical protein MRS44_002342 [Fusarium solani]|uniref:uncharacterized protein n=1 Tax=Fusarium solani TaxID=169388 RepID=UPI0032C42108|nr:hypothetical protein MRS44_002342 [Fusarium solani]